MKSKGKKRVMLNKDEYSENWCFVCKDGGDLRLCDRKDCLKSYHPECVGKDDSFLESERYWACAWHSCSRCRKSSELHCYTCINSVCRRCFPASDFLLVKENSGFCSLCLRLVLLIEENKDYDSDGDKVDFKDRETCEGLYMEYYMIIKEQEGFDANDIYAARDRKDNQSGSSSEEFDEDDDDDDDDEDEDLVEEEEESQTDNDDDDDNDDMEYRNKKKGGVKEKQCSDKMSVIKNAMTSSNVKFSGWGSNILMEFLDSIGKRTSESLSQNEVTSIVNHYAKEKKLFHPKRRRMIVCDERLQLLFRRKIISRFRVLELLSTHFPEEKDDDSEEEDEYEDNSSDDLIESKRQRKLLDSEKKKAVKTGSCFASIVVENMKLVYLRRSLLRDLLKDEPESFEEKVIGCYARLKSSLCSQKSRNFYRLVQIKGVKAVSTGESCLVLSNTCDEVCISQFSDEDLCTEECEELKQTMESGQIERLTVEDLQRKAEILHKDITNNWINKELALLNNLIVRANEKGWRRELFDYLERRKKLEDPIEKLKLLRTLPVVIPEADIAASDTIMPTDDDTDTDTDNDDELTRS